MPGPITKRSQTKRAKRIVQVGLALVLASASSVRSFPLTTKPRMLGQLKETTPRVFIDCPGLDLAFLQGEVRFVDCVNDRNEADVEVIITSERTDAGEDFTLTFRGQGDFAGDNDMLHYGAAAGAAPEEVKKGLARTLKMGLLRYVGKTEVSKRIDVSFLDVVKPTAVVDKWKFWVFSLSADSFLNGEKSFRNGMYFASFSANRVTPDIKIRLSLGAMSMKDRFEYEGEVYDSSSDGQEFRGLVVKSLDDHWSVGGYFSAFASSYDNIKFGLSPAPAVEYDLFPYSESTRRQLRFLYRLNFKTVSYIEETMYEKTSESLWQQALSVSLELKRKWGEVSTSLEGSNYFHDFGKNRVELWSELSIRLFSGLNFNLHGGYSAIHDQLSLPAGGASIEDILLRRKQLEKSYDYHFSVGLSYTFGSTESKVVNPRFGDGAGGISVNIRM